MVTSVSSFIKHLFLRMLHNKSTSALKCNVKKLVPHMLKAHRKSNSLMTQERNKIRPFSVYSIKKNKLVNSKINSKLDITPQSINMDLQFDTEGPTIDRIGSGYNKRPVINTESVNLLFI